MYKDEFGGRMTIGKTAMDYLMFLQGIDSKDFGDKLLNAALYSSNISISDDQVNIAIRAGKDDE